jgi:hypothetical protein
MPLELPRIRYPQSQAMQDSIADHERTRPEDVMRRQHERMVSTRGTDNWHLPKAASTCMLTVWVDEHEGARRPTRPIPAGRRADLHRFDHPQRPTARSGGGRSASDSRSQGRARSATTQRRLVPRTDDLARGRPRTSIGSDAGGTRHRPTNPSAWAVPARTGARHVNVNAAIIGGARPAWL